MNAKTLVQKWFDVWERGDFHNIPVSDDFIHTSPYGTINGKAAYLELVEANRDKFLGHRFEVHDALYAEDKACIRYSAIQENFRLEATEWHYVRDGLIAKIDAYYNIEGEISEARKLANLD